MSVLNSDRAQFIGYELGQSAPAATTATTLYTCPSTCKGATDVVVHVSNRSTATTFRVWVAKAAAVDANAQYRAYDTAIGANGVFSILIGDLEPTDLIRIDAGSANLSFQANGIEIR